MSKVIKIVAEFPGKTVTKYFDLPERWDSWTDTQQNQYLRDRERDIIDLNVRIDTRVQELTSI